jgi:hypothetical protein
LTIAVERTIQEYGRPVARLRRFSVRKTFVFSWARPMNSRPSLPVAGEVRLGDVVRALAPFEVHEGHACLIGERLERSDEPGADRGHQRRARDRLAAVVAEEAEHTRHPLEAWHIDVQVQPIEAFDLEGHVITQDGRHGLGYAHRRLRLDGGPSWTTAA